MTLHDRTQTWHVIDAVEDPQSDNWQYKNSAGRTLTVRAAEPDENGNATVEVEGSEDWDCGTACFVADELRAVLDEIEPRPPLREYEIRAMLEQIEGPDWETQEPGVCECKERRWPQDFTGSEA